MTVEKATTLISGQPIIICSKGLGEGLALLSDTINEKVSGNVYCLYGTDSRGRSRERGIQRDRPGRSLR